MDDTMMTFEELFTGYHDILVDQVCSHYALDYDTAETIVVDALLAMRKAHEKNAEQVQYNPKSRFLFILIERRVADYIRRQTHRGLLPEPVELNEDMLELEDPRQDPTRNLQDADFLRTATKGLSQPERLVLIGRYYLKQTGTEIGAALDMTEGRVCQINDDIVRRLQERKADFV